MKLGLFVFVAFFSPTFIAFSAQAWNMFGENVFLGRSPNFWSRRYAERIWGEFFILARRIVGKLPANFSANFDGEF